MKPLIIVDKGAVDQAKLKELECEGYLVVEKMRGLDVTVILTPQVSTEHILDA